MSTLYGENEGTLDAKNRIFVPARFRPALEAEKKDYMMLSLGFDRCIFMFLPSMWDALIRDNKEVFKADTSDNKEEERAFKRVFFGSACRAQLDGQGRVLVPQNLKQYASLGKDIMIRGVGDKAEIWDAQLWKKYAARVMSPASFEKFGKKIGL